MFFSFKSTDKKQSVVTRAPLGVTMIYSRQVNFTPRDLFFCYCGFLRGDSLLQLLFSPRFSLLFIVKAIVKFTADES